MKAIILQPIDGPGFAIVLLPPEEGEFTDLEPIFKARGFTPCHTYIGPFWDD